MTNRKQPSEKPKSETAPSLPLPSLEDFGLAFYIKEDQSLWAEFAVQKTSREISKQEFYQLFGSGGFSATDYPLIEANLALLLDAIKRREAHYSCISIPEPAKIDIYLSSNRLLAGAQVFGAQGLGEKLTEQAVNLILRNSKVTFGILPDVIEYLTSDELHNKLRNTKNSYCTIIALGENFVNGVDGYLVPLIKDASDRRIKKDEQGNINYLEKGDFPFVEEGTPLMCRVEPTKGITGTTVQAKVLRAKDGKDVQFKLKDSSVRLDEDDYNLLVAATGGLPVIYANGAQVEDVLRLQKVDLSTGHVRFKGSVEIREEVRDGMQVIATGDIKVNGSVDAAFLKAGGHIEIAGGAIGYKGSNNLTMRAALKAQHSIKLRFCHEALLEAGQEILIGSQATHSLITAGTFIKIEGKGQAVGGRLTAADYIELNITGAFAYTETYFEIGECVKLEQEYAQLIASLNAMDSKKYRLIEVARAIRKKGKKELAKMKDKLILAKEAIQAEEKELNQKVLRVELELARYYAAQLIIHRKAYPGTLLTLANKKFDVVREMDKVTFYLYNGQVATRF